MNAFEAFQHSHVIVCLPCVHTRRITTNENNKTHANHRVCGIPFMHSITAPNDDRNVYMTTKRRLTSPPNLVNCAIKVGGTDSLGHFEISTCTKFGHMSLNVSSEGELRKLRCSKEDKSSASEVMTPEVT